MTDKKPIITCMECGKVMSSPAQMIAHEGFPCALQQGYKRGFEQGKLAGKKELINQMCKPMEEENALCDRRLGDCVSCEERKKRIKELKSQLKEEAKK